MTDFTSFDVPYIDDGNTVLGVALGWCEQDCVAACCGMDAYVVTVDNLQRWADQAPAGELEIARRQLDEVQGMLKNAPESFYFLDATHARQEVGAWIDSIRAALAAVTPRAAPPTPPEPPAEPSPP